MNISSFCHDKLWNWDNLWRRQVPNVSECLQYNLILLPCGIYILYFFLFILRKFIFYRRANRSCMWEYSLIVFLILLIFHVAYLLIVLSDLIVFALQNDLSSHVVADVVPTTKIILIITSSLSIAHLAMNYYWRRPIEVSPFVFWMVLLLASFPQLYQVIRDEIEKDLVISAYQMWLTVAKCSVNIVLVVLCALPARPGPQYDSVKVCPEHLASPLSRLMFWWLWKQIWTAYKRELSNESVFDLHPMDCVEVNYTKFQTAWKKEWNNFQLRKMQKLLRGRSSSSMSDALRDDDRSRLLAVENDDMTISEEQLQINGNLPQVHFRDSSTTEVRNKMAEDPLSDDKKRSTNAGPSLLKVLILVFGSPFILIWLVQLFHDFLLFGNPLILKSFLKYMDDELEPHWHGYVYVFGFFICTITASALYNQAVFSSLKISLRLRSALIAAIHNKALTICNESRQKSTVGEIVNLMSVDADRISTVCVYLIYPWSSCCQVAIALYLLYQEVGISVFVGIGILVGFMILNSLLVAKVAKYEDKEMEWKDHRIKMLSELLKGIKFLKLYAWELSFQSRITSLRGMEMKYLLRGFAIWGVISVIWDVAPLVILLSTFLVYVYTGTGNHMLSPERAFVSLTLLNMLRFPMFILPGQISIYVNAYVSVKRLNRFFCEGDIDLRGYERDNIHPKVGSPAISISNATFSWTKLGSPILNNIHVQIPSGDLVAVVGKVGVGKSSFLSAILGEMFKVQGFVHTRGRLAYVPQEAWLQNASLRDNILFGKEYDEERYQKVINACVLAPDLALLPAGDATEIGERGINLSGGQKQRISLARAVYHDVDIYLLDDPVSAVDAHVGEQLFNNIIGPKGLLQSKTRIFVTHSIRWLPYVNRILVLNETHSISEDGTYEELLHNGQAFSDFLKTYQKTLEENDEESPSLMSEARVGIESQDIPQGTMVKKQSNEEVGSYHIPVVSSFDDAPDMTARSLRTNRYEPASPINRMSSTAEVRNRRGSTMSHQSDQLATSPTGSVNNIHAIDSIITEPLIREESLSHGNGDLTDSLLNRLTEDEVIESGRVSMKAYGIYFKAAGLCLFAFALVGQSLFRVADVGSNVWLKGITQDEVLLNLSKEAEFLNGTDLDDVLRKMRDRIDWYMMVYCGIGLLEVFLCSFYICLTLGLSFRASKTMHKNLLSRILRAPMSFFDTTPSGRIVNRFSRDIETIDHQLPSAVNDTIGCVTALLACIAVIIFTTPIFLSVIVPLFILYFFIQMVYVPISRQSRRLDSITRSPIFTQFGETVTGAAIIRAFSHENRFQEQSNQLINFNGRFFYIKWSSNRWLGLHMDFLSSFIVCSAVLFCILQRSRDGDHDKGMTAALAGLSVSYALQVTDTLMWLIRQIAELETDAVSLERVKEYTEVEQESPWDVPEVDNDPQLTLWPARGSVRIVNYSLRYRPHLPLVLHQLTAEIRPGERIGVVGRTGAGKSSLTLALFRIVEAMESGVIEIDGQNIAKLGLHLLRSRITILPQDPVLFSGTLRSNLDPFDRHTDEELWSALECSHLSNWVRSQPNQLLYECGEGGSNLSAGQRQLVCLARAILRRSRVLVLDEATAAVDLHTDRLLMQTVREYFRHATLIIIAHRLATIIDADRVMVLDNGRISQFATPNELLSDKTGIFYGLAKDAGLVR